MDRLLLTSDFDYVLPEELIAQKPLEKRDSSRLMALLENKVLHRNFSDILEFLLPGDLLVLNDTKVIPARLFGRKKTGGKLEVFLIKKEEAGEGKEVWKCFIKPAKGLKPGMEFIAGDDTKTIVAQSHDDGVFSCAFDTDARGLEEIGSVPLPPYVKREPVETDKEQYQTVFAQRKGAVAAPTAGLHFTKELLSRIEASGVEIRRITLHTGPGTFMPVRSQTIEGHRMMPEYYEISPEAFEAIKNAKKENRRVVAVGTTAVRALESAVIDGFEEPRLAGETALFIYPGFEFKAVDALITNFHLPCSTLLMLVSAFGGHNRVMDAYREAVKEKYRFYSYGDAMFLLKAQ